MEAEIASDISIAPPFSELTEGVIALSKRHQQTLGQLPFAAFHEAARQGALVVATVNDAVAGYILFRVLKRTGAVMLTQLCVDDQYAGTGVAQRLVLAVTDRYPTAPGLGLKCRKDYDANSAWPHLGFEARGQSSARARDKILIHWWRPINDNTLFTFDPLQEEQPAAAIDANVFRDLHEPRSQYSASIALHDDWLTDAVELVTTAQLSTEIVDAGEELPHLPAALDLYRRLSPSPDIVATEVQRLTPDLMSPDIKDKDRRHIAMAAVGGARYFVTRDANVISHASTVEQLTGLVVLSPSDLLLRLHAEQFDSQYRPEAILDTAAEIVPLAQIPDRGELSRFADSQNRERARDLESIFRATAAEASSGGKLWALTTQGSELAGVVALSVDDETMTVHALRIAAAVHQPTFSRQLIHVLRQEAVNENCATIYFANSIPDYVRDALTKEGFRPSGDRWIGRCPTGVFGPGSELLDSLSQEADAPTSFPELISEAERRFSPAHFATGKVPCYIVPIQPRWSRPLFDDDPPQRDLFRRPMHLGLAREHVYYRSYRAKFEFPARILWYVSGKKANSGFRGTSWLEFAVSDRPRSLYQRFGPQGIYVKGDVEACVSRAGGKATALVFSRTELFTQTVTLQRARELYPKLRKNGALQSMSPINEQVFYDFWNEGQR